jgi:predicted PurR-regulated permease PerM
MLGAKLGGVLGLLIAIPIASFIKDATDSWRAGEFNKIDDILSEPVTVTSETAGTYS